MLLNLGRRVSSRFSVGKRHQQLKNLLHSLCYHDILCCRSGTLCLLGSCDDCLGVEKVKDFSLPLRCDAIVYLKARRARRFTAQFRGYHPVKVTEGLKGAVTGTESAPS